MLTLNNTAAMERAAHSYPDPTLRILLSQRMATFRDYVETDLDELVTFAIVQPGDAQSTVDGALGFSPLENRIDRTRWPAPDFTPSWEWILDHGGWFELVFILGDDGSGIILFVQNDPAVDAELIALCTAYATLPEAASI